MKTITQPNKIRTRSTRKAMLKRLKAAYNEFSSTNIGVDAVRKKHGVEHQTFVAYRRVMEKGTEQEIRDIFDLKLSVRALGDKYRPPNSRQDQPRKMTAENPERATRECLDAALSNRVDLHDIGGRFGMSKDQALRMITLLALDDIKRQLTPEDARRIETAISTANARFMVPRDLYGCADLAEACFGVPVFSIKAHLQEYRAVFYQRLDVLFDALDRIKKDAALLKDLPYLTPEQKGEASRKIDRINRVLRDHRKGLL